MERLIPYFGYVRPIADEFDCGASHFHVEWLVADTDLEVAAGKAATPALEELFRDVESGRVRLAGALVSVEGKPFVPDGDITAKVACARVWPKPLYDALEQSYWRSYAQFEIAKGKLDAQAGESAAGTSLNGDDSEIPAITGNAS